MKKEINSKSRRKWIMGGLAAFASVALLTTGFAVWVVGVTQTKKDGDVTVDVDTAQNQSVTFALKLYDSGISLKEKNTTTNDEDFVKVTGNDNLETDFSISFSEFQISMPTGWFDSIKISIMDPSTITSDESTSSTTKFVDNKVADKDIKLRAEKRKGATYFDLVNDNLSLSDSETFDSKEDNGVTTYTYKSLNTSVQFFKWGSFFDGDAPTDYYNKKVFAGDAAEGKTAANAKFVEDELNAMHSVYTTDNAAIKLNFELTGSDQGKKNA